MSKTTKKVVALLILSVGIAIFPLVTIHDSEFGGADGAAEEVITEINPNYKPWMESLFELPGGETESLLFCLQAALGASVLGFGFGFFVSRKKYGKDL